MKFVSTLALVASVAVAQKLGSDAGQTISKGSSALDNPNVNNGEQHTNSLVDGGNKGHNKFHGIDGSSFTSSASNFGMSDNNLVNPSKHTTTGNSGPTTNGKGNHIGDGLAGLHRRDAVINNYPHSPIWGYPAHGVPVFAPVVGAPIYPSRNIPRGHVNHNIQEAAIVQNQW
ncbi:hypothetical protein LPJ78_004476 [Coemansia sp. RSA 989]|nr:hypothetical protein BX667DRAFT_498631 [Coemansia mojavensis]KAJ1742448.1 hypothetical protein LPJ68_001875 [Coemansia sp. RSA 1086]KAJ1748764.1 hypothetical protein LPJ79_004262 [Coemansia sp. RSA 1821]KAJ1862796.1 hypothetical protein LPJ78_004476 [Coemansia sp. RSA 989]KAJ1870651.1 hypothetical protein LPJ55_004498 [Coemansia sp. RSA 990]KAJ2630113.1 hypothetical protein H4R22_002888 [Coemansia sp. RSA 1290]KAJ2646572.1 hypothetical protein IWW40_005319 [Coemansia sp. RSA 1250]KAJ26683